MNVSIGVVVALVGRELLLARREPEGRASTGNMFMSEGKNNIPIPDRPETNCDVRAVKERLNQLAGLPSLDFAEGAPEPGFQGRPSSRDMMAFLMQPQHIVANPYTLFFKADTTEHREKLKVIFPFVLGAVPAEHFCASARARSAAGRDRAAREAACRRAAGLRTLAITTSEPVL